MEVSNQLKAPAALPLGKKQYQLDRRLYGPQNRSRGGGEKNKFHLLPGI
jgi:hypothetical protein